MNRGSWGWLVRLLILVIPVLAASIALSQDAAFREINSWQVTDYLINYESGFVRRGLWGSLLLFIRQLGIDVNPVRVSLTLSLISLWLIAFVIGRRLMVAPLKSAALLAYSPVFLPVFYFLDPHAAGRKDSIWLIAIALALLVFERTRGWVCAGWMGVFFAMMLPLLMLGHEGTLFFCFLPSACLLWLALKDVGMASWRKKIGFVLLAAMPSLLVLMLILIAPSPSAQAVVDMCMAWRAEFPSLSCQQAPAYFSVFGKNDVYVALARSAFTTREFYSSLLITLVYLALLWAGPLWRIHFIVHSDITMAEGGATGARLGLRSGMTILCLIGMLGSLPVYWLACDFGRWLCLSMVMVVLLVTSPKLAVLMEDSCCPAVMPSSILRAWFGFLGGRAGQFLLIIFTPLLCVKHHSKPPILLGFSLHYIDKFRYFLAMLMSYLVHLVPLSGPHF